MFFQQLAELSPNLDLSLRMMKKGDTITISVLPATADKIQPLTLTATPAELDEKFIDAIRTPVQLLGQLDTTAYEAELRAAVEAKQKEAEEKVAKEVAVPEKKPTKRKSKKAEEKEEVKPEASAEAETPAAESQEEKPVEEPAPNVADVVQAVAESKEEVEDEDVEMGPTAEDIAFERELHDLPAMSEREIETILQETANEQPQSGQHKAIEDAIEKAGNIFQLQNIYATSGQAIKGSEWLTRIYETRKAELTPAKPAPPKPAPPRKEADANLFN